MPHPPTPAAAPSNTPARVVHTSGRRRRTSVHTPSPAATRGTITNYYPNRVYTPHVAAANPPDHDTDKQLLSCESVWLDSALAL